VAVLEDAREDLLHQVLGEVPVPGQAQAEVVEPAVMPLEQDAQPRHGAFAYLVHELSIRRVHQSSVLDVAPTSTLPSRRPYV